MNIENEERKNPLNLEKSPESMGALGAVRGGEREGLGGAAEQLG